MHSQLVGEHIFFPSSGSVLAAARIGRLRREVRWSGGTGLEDVVPIVLGGTEAAKQRVQSDHLFRHGVTGGIGIKTAVHGKALG